MAPATLETSVIDTRTALAAGGYDAIEPAGKRKAPPAVLRSEDAELVPEQRRRLVAGARDVHRNFAILGWMVRKHLDYIATHTLQVKTPNKALTKAIEDRVRVWSKAQNCDIARRHSLGRIIRLAELRRTVDGDVGLLRLSSKRLQAIEGDRIRTPPGGIPANLGIPAARVRHGVYCDDHGAAISYCVCKRTSTSDYSPSAGSFEFERMVRAENLYQHAYFDRFDQTRGISPLAAALNTLRDTYEGFDYALAKAKVGQLFGLLIKRQGSEELGIHSEVESPTAADGSKPPKYKVDLGRGPFKLELDRGDDASFASNDSPGPDFQAFCQVMISVALKALDIPYSFYAENFTNYSGARQALLQYEDACKEKRQDVRDLLDWITLWLITFDLEDGLYPGADLSAISWEWIGKGLSWIDPLKEIQATNEALGACMTSRTRALKEHGIEFSDIAQELAAEQKLLAELGLPTLVGSAAKSNAAAADKPATDEAPPADDDEDPADE